VNGYGPYLQNVVPHIKETMKQTIIIVFLLTGLISCGQQKDRIENVLLECLESSYNEIGVDLNNELNVLEQYLIDDGTLQSNSGQAYFDFYKRVVEINDIPNEIDIDKFENLMKLKPNEYYSSSCINNLKRIDSTEIINSKYYQMTLRMQEVVTNGEISPSSVANAIISVLKPSDFDKPYYRAIALLTILNTSNIETGLKRELLPQKQKDYSDFPSVSILANSKSEIILNNKIVTSETLKNKLYDFIKSNQEHHLIIFSNEKGTTYDFYLKVQNQIFETYSRLRDEKSKELYNKSFSELSETENEKIKEIYPQNIKEQ
jgi:hypothetical protein